jgi:ABC-2 type transport system permease protein
VRAWQVVGSKYLASVIVYGVLWLPSLFNFKFAQWITAGQVAVPDGAMQGAYLILMVMGMFNLAVGCFASSLTANQIVAAILSFTLSLLHFLMGIFVMVVGRKLSDTIVDIVNYFAATEHIRIFTAGLIDTRALVYYLSMSLLFLTFTHHVVEFRRWRP